MKKFIVSTGIIALTIGLSACASSPSVSESPESTASDSTSEAKASIAAESSSQPDTSHSSSPSPSITRTEVIWSDYDPGSQSEIDQMTNAGDCLGINSYFGMAAATEESVRARTGHGNEALNRYLNESLNISNCN